MRQDRRRLRRTLSTSMIRLVNEVFRTKKIPSDGCPSEGVPSGYWMGMMVLALIPYFKVIAQLMESQGALVVAKGGPPCPEVRTYVNSLIHSHSSNSNTLETEPL
jgi:hypothetical protein